MADTPLATWKRVLLYAAFSLVALVAAIFITFPYDTLQDRLKAEADSAGYNLKLGSLGPGFFSVRATKVQLAKKAANPDAPAPEPLVLDSLSVGPSLFPPGLKATGSAFGGSVFARVSGISTTSVKVELDDLDLSKGNLKAFSGIDFAGTVDVALALSIPRAAVGNGPAEPDLGQASGTFSLSTRALAVNGGTANIAIPMYGPEPTPLDLPKIVLGDIDGKLKFDKGAGTVEEFKGKSADVELAATGTLKLAKRMEYAEPNLEVRFKPDPEFQKRLGLIGSALSMVGPDPKDPAWRMGRLTGFLGRPAFR